MADYKYRIDEYMHTSQITKIIPNPDDWDKYKYVYYTNFDDTSEALWKFRDTRSGIFELSYLPTVFQRYVQKLDYSYQTPTDAFPKRTLIIYELPLLPPKDYPSYWNF